jgi:hypothetical protein
MTLQLPDPHASLNEPKRSAPPMSHGSTAQPEDSDARMEKAWLREQLLAGKHSPLCDPITPAYFEKIMARARGVV